MRIALVSEHASQLAAIGGADSGGQNIAVAELAQYLVAIGYQIDVFTRGDGQRVPKVINWRNGIRIIHVEAGPSLHAEARRDNIKVTSVVAGGMRTPFILDRFPQTDPNVLQDPKHVAETVHFVVTQADETVIPEVMVLPMRETSWP